MSRPSPSPEHVDEILSQVPEPPKKTVLGRLLFIPYLLVFFGALVFYDILLRVTTHAGEDVRGKIRDWFQCGMLRTLSVLGTHTSVEGEVQLEAGKPYLLVSNHQSIFDIPFLYKTFMQVRPRYIAKVELSKYIPGVSINLRTDGSALIDRNNPRQALPEIKRAASYAAQNGHGIVIFPEGTRARNGVLKRFRPSGLMTLLKYAPTADVIPIAIDGSWKLMCHPRGPMPLGVHMRMKIGKPIPRDGHSDQECVTLAEEAVRSLLAELRQTA